VHREKLRQRLRALDDPIYAERPADFDEKRVRDKFLGLVAGIRRTFGASVTYEAGPPLIQDASFFGDVTIPAQATESGVEIGVRTSNFGELATFFPTDPDVWDEPDSTESLIDTGERRALEELLSQQGYEFVPLALLFADYDGANQALKDLRSGSRLNWWCRYFDWL
jgi:hypothetical protein